MTPKESEKSPHNGDQMSKEKELREILGNLIPCIQSNCDNNGTLTVGNYGTGPEPEQCQYCFEERFPKIDKALSEINKIMLPKDEVIKR